MKDSLILRYQDLLDTGVIQQDSAQRQAIESLQELSHELCQLDKKRNSLLSWFGSQPSSKHGRYFWGGVGRGKTLLVDLFFDELPIKKKLRMHFHRFMHEVHEQSKALNKQKEPLAIIAKRFAEQAKIICFDEFFVSDIADAMILGRLLEAMFAEGIVFVATSNVPPFRLYEGGLHRDRFLPAISLIEAHTQIIEMDSGTDYRLRTLEQAEIYHTPLDDIADKQMQTYFEQLSPDKAHEETEIPIKGRMIAVKQLGDGVAWFDCEALCGGPRSQNDYIELARIFQTVLMSDVPSFDLNTEDKARRFISLVDEFYDRNVKLILSAAAPITELYQGEKLQFEFKRTQSRLQEMQSKEYLAKPHLP